MRFLWKTQLRREGGKLFPKNSQTKNRSNRKEQLESSRGKRGSYGGVLFLWMLFFGTVIYVVFFSPYLLIHPPVFMSGVENIEESSLEEFFQEKLSGKYLKVLPKNSFFLVQPKRLEVLLKETYPLIQSVSLTRVFPSGLQAVFQERKHIVLWCSGEVCYHLLENGSAKKTTPVFETEANRSYTIFVRDTSLLPVEEGDFVVGESFVPFAASLWESFKESLDMDIENTFTTSSRFADELKIKTGEGFEVYVNTQRPITTSLDALHILFEKEINTEDRRQLKYIDLRTENRIYYSFQDGTDLAKELATPEEKSVENQSPSEKKEEKPKKKE